MGWINIWLVYCSWVVMYGDRSMMSKNEKEAVVTGFTALKDLTVELDEKFKATSELFDILKEQIKKNESRLDILERRNRGMYYK